MSFEIVSERPLTDEEVGLLQKATALFGTGYDRRELLRLLGLSGAVVVTSFALLRPARAQSKLIPVVVQAVVVTSEVFLRSVIPAAITVVNPSLQALRGPLAVKYIDSDGLVANQATIPVSVRAESELKLTHSSFRARKVGDSEYHAVSEEDSEQDDFEVLQPPS
jgi:hypothetical protein